MMATRDLLDLAFAFENLGHRLGEVCKGCEALARDRAAAGLENLQGQEIGGLELCREGLCRGHANFRAGVCVDACMGLAGNSAAYYITYPDNGCALQFGFA